MMTGDRSPEQIKFPKHHLSSGATLTMYNLLGDNNGKTQEHLHNDLIFCGGSESCMHLTLTLNLFTSMQNYQVALLPEFLRGRDSCLGRKGWLGVLQRRLRRAFSPWYPLTSSCRVGLSPFITQDRYRFFSLRPKATGILSSLSSPCTKLMQKTTGERKRVLWLGTHSTAESLTIQHPLWKPTPRFLWLNRQGNLASHRS